MNHGEHRGSKNTKVDDARTQCQVKQEAEMEEANGGEAGDMELSAAAAVGRSGSGTNREEEFITLSIDKSVLHCPLCTLPLKPPIFQCEVGHLACGACRAQLHSNRCLLCVDGGGGAYDRSPGIDVFFRGVMVPCPYAVYGCRSDVAYCDAGEQRRVCPCAPCGCPERGCPFLGAPPMLRGHVAPEHPRYGPSSRSATASTGASPWARRRRGGPSSVGTTGACSSRRGARSAPAPRSRWCACGPTAARRRRPSTPARSPWTSSRAPAAATTTAACLA